MRHTHVVPHRFKPGQVFRFKYPLAAKRSYKHNVGDEVALRQRTLCRGKMDWDACEDGNVPDSWRGNDSCGLTLAAGLQASILPHVERRTLQYRGRGRGSGCCQGQVGRAGRRRRCQGAAASPTVAFIAFCLQVILSATCSTTLELLVPTTKVSLLPDRCRQ